MILHTVNRSPFSDFALRDCLVHIAADDCLLLLEDGVVAVSANTEQRLQLLQLHENKKLFVLKADLQARGLSTGMGQIIDYTTFVNLVIECKSQIAW